MSPNPQGGTPAGDATLAIKRLARQTGGDVQELQTLYVLEALLARLASSVYRDDFVLKGGVLLAAFAVRRPTKDIDLQATGIANDEHDVAERIREIATLDLSDGVIFDANSMAALAIRTDNEYAGIRVKIVGLLGRARLTVGIDVNFGDPIWPDPRFVELPRIVQLDQPPIELLGYPLTMVLAEKIVTALDRGPANTRWRDFADVYTLTRVHSVTASDLAASLSAVAEHRRITLGPLLPSLEPMPQIAQPKWRAWRTRVHRESELPQEFADVLNAVANFADSAATQTEESSWNPYLAKWETHPRPEDV